MHRKKLSQLVRFSRISSRISSWMNLLLVGLLSSAMLGGALILTRVSTQLGEQTRQQHALTMSNSVNMISSAINLWVRSNQRVVQGWTQDAALHQSVEALLQIPPGPDQLRNAPALATLRTQLADRLTTVDAMGFFIIGPGDISYGSMRDENLGTRNLISTLHPDLLQQAWGGQAVVIPPVPSDVALDQRELPAREYSSLFLAVPIAGKSGLTQAVLTVRFDSQKTVEQLIDAASHVASIDLFAFDRSLRFVTPPKYLADQLEDRFGSATDKRFFDARVERPGDGQGRPQATLMARQARDGTDGLAPHGYTSYHGNRVIGAWQWNDHLQMGFASEIDEREAMSTLRAAHHYIFALCFGLGLMSLAVVVTSVIYNHMARRSAATIRTDALTGVASRRHFDQQMEEQFEVARRSELPLTLIMIDVDQFKQFNDNYGHAAGDTCLEVVAECLKQVCARGTDLAARVGGEEFALLLPMTDPPGAAKLVLEFQDRLRRAAVPHEASDVAPVVTCSVGIATVLVNDLHHTPKDLFKEADANLYKAKGAGRNRVIATNPDSPSWSRRGQDGQSDTAPYPFDQSGAA